MTIILTTLPFILSFLVGILLIEFLFFSHKQPFLLKVSLGLSLGLGLSGQLTFLSLLIYKQFNIIFLASLHLSAIIFLAIKLLKKYKLARTKISFIPKISPEEFIAMALMLVFAAPMIQQAYLYPNGGWDAWSVWNFKAKMIFLGGENWKNMFEPVLWRTSPHYPFLLPAINAWGWSFLTQTSHVTPLITSVIFTYSTAALAFSFMQKSGMKFFALIVLIPLLSLPIYILYATSQYADIVIGFYLLSALGCLVTSQEEPSAPWGIIVALSLGILSFVKPEGMLLALIIATFTIIHLNWHRHKASFKNAVGPFVITALIMGLLPFIFYAFMAPKNITMINGLISETHPSTLTRLQFILSYFGVDFIGSKWNGLLAIIVAGVLINWKTAFSPKLLIVPLSILSYLSVITAYYYINTHFEIGWWLANTSTRILVGVIPAGLFWAAYSFSEKLKRP